MHDLTIPFTNNLAECAIGMPKVKRRISGSFCALIGVENFCVIRTYLNIALEQGLGMLHAIQGVLSGQVLALAQD